MSKLNLNIDVDKVQLTVADAIQPAVNAALAKIDVASMIEAELIREPAPRDRYLPFLFDRDPRSQIQTLVSEAVSDAAKQFVSAELEKQRPQLEAAFKKMMANSASKFTRAFFRAAESALEEDWSFKLSVDVEHELAERSSDD